MKSFITFRLVLETSLYRSYGVRQIQIFETNGIQAVHGLLIIWKCRDL